MMFGDLFEDGTEGAHAHRIMIGNGYMELAVLFSGQPDMGTLLADDLIAELFESLDQGGT